MKKSMSRPSQHRSCVMGQSNLKMLPLKWSRRLGIRSIHEVERHQGFQDYRGHCGPAADRCLGLLRFSQCLGSALYPLPHPSFIIHCLCLSKKSSSTVFHCPALSVLLVVSGVSDVQWSCRSSWFETSRGGG